MNPLFQMNQDELLSQTKRLVREELRIGLEVLKHLREVERRRLYLERGYSSLFAFCVTELGYSEPQAQLRIDAMRALRDTPEIEEQVRSGALPITSVVTLQRFFRREKLRTGNRVEKKERLALFQQVQGKSTREVERVLVAKSPESALPRERQRLITEKHVEIRIVVTEEVREKLEMLKAHYSHRMKDVTSTAELLDLLASDALKRAKPERSSAPTALSVEVRRPSVALSQFVRARDSEGCSYVDPKTGRRCGSRYFLQVDHVVPFSKGGKTDPENLRVLCGAHNRLVWDNWQCAADG
jgi:hypothetical protein